MEGWIRVCRYPEPEAKQWNGTWEEGWTRVCGYPEALQYSEAVPGWKDESVSAGIRKLHCEAVLDAGPALCPVITATWDREEVWLYTQKSFAVCEKNFFYRPWKVRGQPSRSYRYSWRWHLTATATHGGRLTTSCVARQTVFTIVYQYRHCFLKLFVFFVKLWHNLENDCNAF